MLTRARYRVVQAKDGLEALEKLQNGLDCSLAIVDIEMPRMDGFEFLRSVRSTQRFAKIPVAMLTSRSGEKHRQMAMELGANEYFTKPYSEALLLEAIPKLIKQ
jgi:chemosensory pili system protein ChpA (sensor histidine kinase/response regulator)